MAKLKNPKIKVYEKLTLREFRRTNYVEIGVINPVDSPVLAEAMRCQLPLGACIGLALAP